jgi:hypothetical protein
MEGKGNFLETIGNWNFKYQIKLTTYKNVLGNFLET